MISRSKQGIESERDTILDSIADGVFTVDSEWRITSFNRAAEDITGITRNEAVGSRCCDVFKASICENDCALKRTLETGRPVIGKAVFIIDAEGNKVPISISTAILKDKHGAAIGGVETFRDLSVVEDLRKELTRKFTFGDIISKNHKMQLLFDILPEVAESESTVLIEGESGTGKELFARAIHNLSLRRKRPLVTVNCGALPDTLLESELFGYKAGAFTDAKKDKPGRFALAKGGTIFLDEIGDVSPALQVRLLRVLQDRTYEPLGATEPVQADVRVVAATNKDLSKLVDEGQFRQDLYYRINVVKLAIPPLRERMDDVPLLVERLIARFNRLRGKDISSVSPEVLAALMNHSFPGNVRELENIIEHAFVLCRNGLIMPEHLPQNMRPETSKMAQTSSLANIQEIEAHFIKEALRRHDGNRSVTARELGIHKTTLWRKMKRLGITIT
ncbi:sigma 54-interacting transcriptional regulator [Candidatus Poribacteria bacterium]|nr:sigma 54-interacting transcriptional regulator [Candidatus Poribacteria bacterium]